MFERFTARAIKAIMIAQEEARRLGHNRVGTEQLLTGLAAQETGLSHKILSAAGLTLQECRQAVESEIGRGDGFVAVEIPFTDDCKRALELSWDEARKLESESIDSSHLLLGLLRVDDGVAATILRSKGISAEVLRVNLLKAM